MQQALERRTEASQAQPQKSETQTSGAEKKRGIAVPATLVTLLFAIGMWATLNLHEDRGTQPATNETPVAVPLPEAVMAGQRAFETPEFGTTEEPPRQVLVPVAAPEPPVVTGNPGAQ